MPETINLPEQAKVSYYGREFEEGLRKVLALRLRLAGEEMKIACQKNISVSSRSSGPSKSGEYPHADTGRLRNSIFVKLDEPALAVSIGTNLSYGLMLEFGTSGGQTIRPVRKKFLSWIDRTTGQRKFAKEIKLGPIKKRSFLRRSMMEMQSRLVNLLTAKIPDGVLVSNVRIGS